MLQTLPRLKIAWDVTQWTPSQCGTSQQAFEMLRMLPARTGPQKRKKQADIATAYIDLLTTYYDMLCTTCLKLR